MPGTFVYTPAAGTVLSAGAAQTLSVTFTPTDAANYTTATKAVAINVLKATPVITWATPADIVYGDRAERDAAERDDDGARHVRLHAGGRHGALGRRGADAVGDLHADRRGELHERDEGGRDQRHQGDAGHHLGDAGGHRLRHRAGATQLNATTTVPGTFVYTPAAGTVLTAGAAQTLSVTFTPTDAANYTNATKAVAINVLKATPVITWATPADIVYGTALERDAAERDDDRARHVRLHAGRRRRCSPPARRRRCR